MAPGCFLDTNVLLYAVSSEPGERHKRQLAQLLLQERDWTVSVQVLQEFYVQATRPTLKVAPGSGGLERPEVLQLIDLWKSFAVQPLTLAVLDQALNLHQRYPLSYWDCAILAAASAAGCNLVLSEGMGNGETYAGITVMNPFRALSP